MYAETSEFNVQKNKHNGTGSNEHPLCRVPCQITIAAYTQAAISVICRRTRLMVPGTT